MEQERSLRTRAGIAAAVVFLSIYGMGALRVEALSNPSDQFASYLLRPDVITIDTLTVFGKLERPPVAFLHDKHTDTLKKKNKDCMTCHLSENERLSPKFKRLEDTGRKAVMDIYHNNCITCHAEMRAAGEKAGPIVCGQCHPKKPLIMSSGVPMSFDKSLHYRHSTAQKDKCERCHHEYDPQSQELVYVKDKEGTCRYCHKQKTEVLESETRISMRLASHVACIDCHRKTLAKDMTAGPVRCSGCHDIEQQIKIEKVDKVPRMKRNQPDVVLIKTNDKEGLKNRMYRVPFSHKAHEKYNDTCRVCHHADLKSCVSCHSLEGKKEGNHIMLEQAMHQLDSKLSCIGCHKTVQQDQRCAGCHAFLAKGRKQASSYCMKCHMAPPPESTGVLNQAGEARLARMIPEIWQAIFGISYDVDMPEKVVIKELVDRYEPVEFKHRQIIQEVRKRINGSSLAAYFHPSEATLCQGCHHNSPTAGKPPRCANCHGKPFKERYLFVPGLRGAYHRQCMGCHDQMGIEKPVNVECAGCHVERKLPNRH
ncbi:MAG: cytochrome c3 family protein [Candidatus Desulfatibia sp.]|uniref:sulfate respiration complex hexadecaheme cytochrome HmcA n=1 Tax=Candidatus Desulfatibia sp. TaxID=3101189 RepID=UPI002F3097DF